MRKYEMVLILDSSLEEDAVEKELSKISAIIEKNGGSILETAKWGVKKLAYLINHKESGNYIILNFTCDDDSIVELDRVNKINDNVIRHMIVKDKEIKDQEKS